MWKINKQESKYSDKIMKKKRLEKPPKDESKKKKFQLLRDFTGNVTYPVFINNSLTIINIGTHSSYSTYILATENLAETLLETFPRHFMFLHFEDLRKFFNNISIPNNVLPEKTDK